MSEVQIQVLHDQIWALERRRERQRMLGRLSGKEADSIAYELHLLRRELQLRIADQKVVMR